MKPEVKPPVIPEAVTPKVTNLQPLRDKWLQTGNGKRYTELKGMYGVRSPKETIEYRKLEQEFLELGMTSRERLAWLKEGKALDVEDAAMERADLAAEAEVTPPVTPKPVVKPEVTQDFGVTFEGFSLSQEQLIKEMVNRLPFDVKSEVRGFRINKDVIGDAEYLASGIIEFRNPEALTKMSLGKTVFYHEIGHAYLEVLMRKHPEIFDDFTKAMFSDIPSVTVEEARRYSLKQGMREDFADNFAYYVENSPRLKSSIKSFFEKYLPKRLVAQPPVTPEVPVTPTIEDALKADFLKKKETVKPPGSTSNPSLGDNPGKGITKKEALSMLERLSATPDEAVRLLVADKPEAMAIVKGIQERCKRQQRKWAPMDPREGPPLPRIFAGLRWPWREP